nr:MAG TPA: hypothetical protein [Caudoviricetes sp.]
MISANREGSKGKLQSNVVLMKMSKLCSSLEF